MAESTYLPIITLNGNEPNAPIKRYRMAQKNQKNDKKHILTHNYLKWK